MMVAMLILFSAFTFFGIFCHRSLWIINPVVGFIAFNWIMGCGAFLFLDLSLESDIVHCAIIVVSPLLLTLGSIFVVKAKRMTGLYREYWRIPFVPDKARVIRRAAIMLVISSIITVIYYRAVGYNLLLSTLGSGVDNFTAMRLQAYSGDKYFAPGYVNQFKNTILPILYLFFCFRLKGSRFGWLFIGLGLAFVLYALLGTGQRTFLVISFLMFLYCVVAYRGGSVPVRYLLAPLLVVFALFSYISIQLGRSNGAGIISGFGEVLHRVFESNQYSAVVGFRYVYDVVGVRFGAPWFQDFAGLLPGVRGDTISNQVFYILFGSYKGTSPLSVWGSIYYNFGLPGIVAIGLAMGAGFQLTYLSFLRGKKSLFRVFCYSVVFLYFSIWVAGGPVQLINNGLLAVVFLLLLSKITYKTDIQTRS